MEAEWQADRSLLRELIHSRADLSLKQIAAQIGRSYSWAKKWAKRLSLAPPEDLEVLHSRSRARKTPAPAWDPLVLRRVEQIRLFPPEGLQRTPGRHQPFCITCLAMSSCASEVVACPARHEPSGSSCTGWACWPKSQRGSTSRFRCASRWKRCRSISKMPVPSRLIPAAKASNNMSWRFAILWTREPRSCFQPRCMTISMPQRLWRR